MDLMEKIWCSIRRTSDDNSIRRFSDLLDELEESEANSLYFFLTTLEALLEYARISPGQRSPWVGRLSSNTSEEEEKIAFFRRIFTREGNKMTEMTELRVEGYSLYMLELMKRIVRLMEPSLIELLNGIPLIHIIIKLDTNSCEQIALLDKFLHKHSELENNENEMRWPPRSGLTPVEAARRNGLSEVQINKIRTRVYSLTWLRPSVSHIRQRTDSPSIDQVCDTLWNRPQEFKENLHSNILSKEEDDPQNKAIKEIYEWIKGAIERLEPEEDSFKIEVQLSGSVAEGTRLLPLEEFDIVLYCYIDVLFKLENSVVCAYPLPVNEIITELERESGKNPFNQMFTVYLAKYYDRLGQKGSVFDPKSFYELMKDHIMGRLTERPSTITLPSRPEDYLKLTRVGPVLCVHYEPLQREIEIDLVSIVRIPDCSREVRSPQNKIFDGFRKGIPNRDMKQYKIMKHTQIFKEGIEGLVAKGNDQSSDVDQWYSWNLSFTFGERKLLDLPHARELYQTIKYLNSLSKDEVVKSYMLKEMLLCFIVEKIYKEGGFRRDQDLRDSVRDLYRFFAPANQTGKWRKVSNPFFFSKFGSDPGTPMKKLLEYIQKSDPNRNREGTTTLQRVRYRVSRILCHVFPTFPLNLPGPQ